MTQEFSGSAGYVQQFRITAIWMNKMSLILIKTYLAIVETGSLVNASRQLPATALTIYQPAPSGKAHFFLSQTPRPSSAGSILRQMKMHCPTGAGSLHC